MAKTDLLRTIDQNSDSASFIEDQYYRPADVTPPPIPTGFSVEDAPGGIQARVNFNADRAHIVSDFDCFILYRAAALDVNGDPIGTVMEVGRFSGASHFVSVQPPGQHYFYAIKSRDHYNNQSDYSDWHLGMSLRDTGVADNFEDYGGNVQVTNDDELYWLQISAFESESGWTNDGEAGTISNDTTNFVEGSQGIRSTSEYLEEASGDIVTFLLTNSLDFSAEGRFTNDDYITVWAYLSASTASNYITFFFYSGGYSDYYTITKALSVAGNGNYLKLKKSDFTEVGSPSGWGAINEIAASLINEPSGSFYITLDDMRVVKASVLDPTTYSDTGDKWQPVAADNLAATGGEWHIYQDMPGADYALGNIKTAAGESYLITREDRRQDSATHAAMIELREDGQAGMLMRVQPGVVRAESPALNAQFNNSSAETVGKTHVPTATNLTYGDDTTYGAYVIKDSSSDVLSYASVSLVDSRGEATIHLAFSPDYAYTGADNYIFYHGSNLQVYYNATDDKFYAVIEAGGSTTTLTSAVQTFAANDNIVLDVVIDETTASLYVNGVLADSDTLADLVSTTADTLYIAQTAAGIYDYTGKIYQVLIDHEAAVADDVTDWYNGFLSGHKVASPEQRNYYALEVDTTNTQVELNYYRIGWNVQAIATAVDYAAADDTVYHVAAILDNLDDDGDGDYDRLRIKAYISTELNTLFAGDSQIFSTVLTSGVLWSGFVGFKSDGVNCRFGDMRAGSPHRAHVAERAKVADYALVAGRVGPGGAVGGDVTNADTLNNQYPAYYLNRDNHTGTQLAATISDFDTEVGNNTDVAANTAARHDAVTVTDTTSIDFTLTTEQAISAVVLPAGVDHNSLSNYVANKHIDHTAVSITGAGALGGGGTIASDRTITLNTPGGLSATSTNDVGTNHTHAIDSTIARSAITITAGDGLSGGGDISANRTLAVGAGDGVDVAADSVAVDVTDFIDTAAGLKEDASNNIQVNLGTGLTFSTGAVVLNYSGTPGTIAPDASAAAGTSAYAARTDHVHAIATAAPGANSVNLSASAEGTGNDFARALHTHNLDQSIAPTWTGIHKFTAAGQPTVDLGTDWGYYNHKWRTIHAGELRVETLVAQDVMATIGGQIVVAPTTKLIADAASGDTSIDVEHNNLANTDYVILKSAPGGVPQFEVMRIASTPTTITGGYRYTVTRNVDATGANDWYAGDAVMELGAGYIDLTATSTVLSDYGPTIAIYDRTSATTWNDLAPVTAMGNLQSFFDYSGEIYGLAAGNDLNKTASTGFRGMTVDPTNGLRLYNTDIKLYEGSTLMSYLNSDGTALLGNTTEIGDFDANKGIKFDYDTNTLSIAGSVLIGNGASFHATDVKLHLPLSYAGGFEADTNGHDGTAPTTCTAVNGVAGGPYGNGMAQFAVATTNLITNPTFESSGSSYWTWSNSTATYTTDTAFGSRSASIASNNTGTPYIYNAGAGLTVSAGTSYTFSAWVKAANTASIGLNAIINLREAGGAVANATTAVTKALTGDWQRITVTRAIVESDRTQINHSIYGPTTGTMLISAVQLTATAYQQPFVYGDMNGCSWSGTQYASTSTSVASELKYPINTSPKRGTVFCTYTPSSYATDSAYHGILAIGTTSSASGVGALQLWKHDTNVLYARLRSATNTSIDRTVASSTIGYVAGDKVFIAMTWEDGGNLTLYAYVNGVLKYSGATAIPSGALAEAWKTNYMWVGEGYGGYNANGGISDVVLSDRVYTADEVRAIALSGSPVIVSRGTHEMYVAGGNGSISVNENGIFALANKTPSFALSNANGLTWSGLTLDAGDFLFGERGSGKGGWLTFDRSTGVFKLGYGTTDCITLNTTGATIVGSITANTGYIGGESGWAIATKTITGASDSKIVSGVLQSSDWGTSAGGQIDLVNKTIKFGGSSAPKFSVAADGALSATGASISGSLSAASGNVTIDANGINITPSPSGTSFNEWNKLSFGDYTYISASSVTSELTTIFMHASSPTTPTSTGVVIGASSVSAGCSAYTRSDGNTVTGGDKLEVYYDPSVSKSYTDIRTDVLQRNGTAGYLYVPLTTPYSVWNVSQQNTSAANAYLTLNSTIPAEAKAIVVQTAFKQVSASGDYYLSLGMDGTNVFQVITRAQVANRWSDNAGIVNLTTASRLYYKVVSYANGDAYCSISIQGYFI